jgi:hypothetical protein
VPSAEVLVPLCRSIVGAHPLPFVAAVLDPPEGYERPQLALDVLAVVPALSAAYPVLFSKIVDGRSHTPRLGRIDSFRPVEATHALVGGRSLDDAFLEAMAIPVDVLGSAPLWRVFYGWLGSGECLVGILAHHSFADGAAVLEFSRTLVELLTTAGKKDAPSLANVQPPSSASSSTDFHPPIEDLVDVRPSSLSLVGVMYRELLLPRLPSVVRAVLPSPPTKWAGAPPSVAPYPRERCHRTLAVSPERVASLLTACRKNGISLTSLLHGAIAVALRPETAGLPFESTTNVNARRLFTTEQAAGIPFGTGTYVGVVYATSPATAPTGADEVDALWTEARTHYATMRRPTAFANSVKVWGMLAYVPDQPAPNGWEEFFRSKLLGAKSEAFELSNLGSTTFACSTTREGAGPTGWVLKRAIFSQPPQPTSPVGLFSVLSSDVGMEIAVGWEAGIAEVDRVLDRLEQVLATVA